MHIKPFCRVKLLIGVNMNGVSEKKKKKKEEEEREVPNMHELDL